jgi:hypothetical protein
MRSGCCTIFVIPARQKHREGDQFLERFIESYYSQRIVEWEFAMNHNPQIVEELKKNIPDLELCREVYEKR